MPKRIIDGDAMWRSDKIAAIEEDWMRAEFAWLLANALANGSFECNPRLIWSRCYAYTRRQMPPPASWLNWQRTKTSPWSACHSCGGLRTRSANRNSPTSRKPRVLKRTPTTFCCSIDLGGMAITPGKTRSLWRKHERAHLER